MRFALLLLLTLFSLLTASAQDYTLEGRIMHRSRAIAYAPVHLAGTAQHTLTDSTGHFQLTSLARDTYDLVVNALGFQELRRTITLSTAPQVDLGVLQMDISPVDLETVVVSSNLRPTFVRDAASKIDVVTDHFLKTTTSPVNLTESVQLINGVEEIIGCGVCGTNSISINGLPGPYTAILIDGLPLYGGLASVYGLNGIPRSLIRRLEVVKGPASTLFGSEAMAGVINVITQATDDPHTIKAEWMGNSLMENFAHLVLSGQAGRWRHLSGIDLAYANRYSDRNDDGFGDFVLTDRLSLFNKWTYTGEQGGRLDVLAKLYLEDRRNGLPEYLQDRAYRSLRGSDQIYGESIYTQRGEIMGHYQWSQERPLALQFAYSYHDQDSYYGADHYLARQHNGFLNFLWKPKTGAHQWLIGSGLRLQDYDDNTVATEQTGPQGTVNTPDRQITPGLFVEDEWQIDEQWLLLAGARLDYYRRHGMILSPRLNLRYKPSDWTTLRAGFGTGFRTVNLFTEDHAFISGQRDVQITETLRPERSWNINVNAHHVFVLGPGQGSFDIDLFHTRFSNKILPDYDTPGLIVYRNLDGYARSRGVNLKLDYSLHIPLQFSLSGNWQRVTFTEPDDDGHLIQQPGLFARNWSHNGSVTYQWRKPGMGFSYGWDASGPMALPEVVDWSADGSWVARPTVSRPFTLHYVQVSKSLLHNHMEIFAGVRNLFDFRQAYSPLSALNDPDALPGFSPFFDTVYAYGPLRGRTFYVGVRWEGGD